MTITLDLTPEQEMQLNAQTMAAGLSSPIEYLLQLIGKPSDTSDSHGSTLLGRLNALGVIGVVEGTPGPGDGRAWSEIELTGIIEQAAK